MSFDYGATDTLTSHVPSAKLPIGGVVAVGTTDTYSLAMQWVRLRAYLPNGANPKTTFGSLTSALTATPNPYTLTNQTIDLGQVSLANTVISNGISGTTSYTGNWVWYPPSSSNIVTANTIFALLPANNALTLTINAVAANSLKMTFNSITYYANTIGINTIYGTWTFNASAADANNDLGPSPALTNTITINPALTAPTPTASAPSLDRDQAETITGVMPSSGTSPYSYIWQVSINGGAFTTTNQCTANTGGNQISGNVITCSIAANQLTATDNYNFRLKLTDSASTPTTASSANALVNVAALLSKPSAPTLSASKLDISQIETVNGIIPSGGTSLYSYSWLISINSAPYVSASECLTSSGSNQITGNTITCTIPANTLGVGVSYNLELQVADSATSPEVQTSPASNTITTASQLTVATPTASLSAIDADQNDMLTGTIPSTGTPLYSYSWQVSINGAAFSTSGNCLPNSGSNQISGNTVTCSIAANQLTATDNYNFQLKVTDGASTPATISSANALVTVSSPLTVASKPAISANILNAGQTETLNSILPSTGTPPYTYTWHLSINGGAFSTATECTQPTGSGQNAGNTVTCTIPGNTLAAGNSYNFAIEIADSASSPESAFSASSNTITVTSTATSQKPGISAPNLDADEIETVTGITPTNTIPAPYSYKWLISTNSMGFVTATTQCQTYSGAGQAANTVETCTIPANTLSAGATYNFELQATDTTSTTTNSLPSNTVTVYTPLTASSTPLISASGLDRNQVETLNSILPSTGTPPYTYTWHISVNGGSFSTATECTQPTGSGQSAGNTVTCTIPANTLDAGNSYNFALEIADSATAPESQFSGTSNTVAVYSQLAAPSAPTVFRPKIEFNQPETINDTMPSSGTPPYSYAWLMSTNGQSYSATTPCATSSGSGIPAGNIVTCSISPNTLTVGNTYNFELTVTDSANSPNAATSPASTNIIVHPQLTQASTPSVSSSALDIDEAETVNSILPSTGFPPYSYIWLVSVNSGGYAAATECTPNSGAAAAGNTVTCTIHANTLTVGNTYNFELEINGSATTPEVTDSLPSNTITVDPALSSSIPIITYSTLDTNNFQVATISSFGGTPPYTYNFGIYNSTTTALLTSGSQTTSATTDSFTFNPTVPGTYYTDIIITDSANVPESLSVTSGTFLVNLGLQVPTTPTLNRTNLGLDQNLLIGSTVSGGTPPYTYLFIISNATTGAVVASSGNLITSSTSQSFIYNATTSGAFKVNVTVTETAIPPSPARATSSAKSAVFTVGLTNSSSPSPPFTGGLPPATTLASTTTIKTVPTTTMAPTTTIYPGINSTFNFTRGEKREIKVSNTLSVTLTSSSGGSFNVTITNITNSTTPPPSYDSVAAFRISVKPPTNISISLSMGYPCSIQSSEVAPYFSSGSTWTRISNFSVNPSTCTVIVSAHSGTVGLFYAPSPTTPAPISNVTTTQAPQPPMSKYVVVLYIVIIIAAAIIIYWLIVAKRRHRKRERPA
jgi:hypothetical protein